jgi:Metallo-peptidase family M12B Reprolysin-like
MESVRSIMNCIGVDTSGRVSLLFHLFGFFRARVPSDPCSSATAQVSLLDHVNSLKGRHVHLNIIRVGVDNFTDDEIDRIDSAIYRTRDIYRTVNLGVGRIEHYDVLASDANGHDDIGSEAEAEDLTQEWTIPNDGLDVFMVDNISDPDFVGISNVDGPCDKNADEMNGVIGGEVNRTAEAVARTFPHEIGHYLGLEHNHGDAPDCPDTTAECDNLMAQTRCAIPPPLGTGCGNGVCQAILLIAAQGNTVRDHCSVQDGC